ncbi:hypothetical protein CRYUN_Cryun18bG0092900 [Craigia yunnanensis]
MFVSDKKSSKTVVDSQNKEGDSTNESLKSSSSRIGKNNSSKDTSPSALNALNKFISQIKKPAHRKNSPLNWFPRKKIDSYLKRKIKMLQQERLHTRQWRLVKQHWWKHLGVEYSQASRIRSKEAEELLLKAQKTEAEAFESATALGVIMYDTPNCPQSTCQIETSSVNRAGSATHTVRASFETAFEVDKKVAAAVKTAFMRLACCPSFSKDEFKDLLRKINENPDTGDSNLESMEFSSECESEPGSELETFTQKDGFMSEDFNCKISAVESRKRKFKRRHSLEKFNMEKLVEMMLERLKCLQEDELSSLATIVATCGLNAALAEVENTKLHNPCSIADHPSASALNFAQRTSSIGAGTVRKINQTGQVDSELPTLDKFLVKHMTKLEREFQEARSRRNESKDESAEEEIQEEEKKFKENSGVESRKRKFKRRHSLEKFNMEKLVEMMLERLKCLQEDELSSLATIVATCGLNVALAEVENTKLHNPCSIADHPSASALNFAQRTSSIGAGTVRKINQTGQVDSELPTLDKFLVKHMTKLEREFQEARSRRNESKDESAEEEIQEKEKKFKENSGVDHKNSDTSVEAIPDLGSILVKHSSKLEKEIQEAKRNSDNTYELNGKKRGGMSNGVPSHKKGDILKVPSLDKFLVKHVSRLEREVEEAKYRRKNDLVEKRKVANLENEVLSEKNVPCTNGEVFGKEKYQLEKGS